jgi:hypothetical protein
MRAGVMTFRSRMKKLQLPDKRTLIYIYYADELSHAKKSSD